MPCSLSSQARKALDQLDCVCGVQFEALFTQFAKLLIFCRSASVQVLPLNACTQALWSKGIAGNWPQAEYFPPSPLRALATLSHVEDGEFPLPHPAAPSSSAAHPSTIRRMTFLPFSLSG